LTFVRARGRGDRLLRAAARAHDLLVLGELGGRVREADVRGHAQVHRIDAHGHSRVACRSLRGARLVARQARPQVDCALPPRGAEVVEDRAKEAQLHLTKWRLSYSLCI